MKIGKKEYIFDWEWGLISDPGDREKRPWQCSAASDQGPNCLPMSHKKDAKDLGQSPIQLDQILTAYICGVWCRVLEQGISSQLLSTGLTFIPVAEYWFNFHPSC